MQQPSITGPGFLHGGGEMGALMRAHDWSQSSLGDPRDWPQALRTAVRLILNSGHPMYIWWGLDGACLYNDAYRESIGPERHPHSLGRPAREVWEEIWDIIGPQIEQVRSGGGATWHVNHLVPITRHGRREDVYWTYSYSPIDDESAPNGIGGVLVVCTETTQQVLAAQALQRERDRFAQLFEQSPIFMALLSGPEHRIDLVNPGYLQLVGHRPVLHRTVAEALPEAVNQGYVRLLDQVFATGEAYHAVAAPYILQPEPGAPGVERLLDFVYQPLKDPDGSVTGIIVQGADVTDRARADAALKASEAQFRDMAIQLTEANRLKDEFLATVSHELRTPLNAVLGYARMLRSGRIAREKTNHVYAVVERNAEALRQIIEDILDVSRIVSGALRLNLQPVDVREVVSEAVASVQPVADQKGVTIAVDIASAPYAHADASRLQQVVWNLLSNAIKFTPPGGRVDVAVGQQRTGVSIIFRDTGRGIDPAFLPHIFEPFRQGDASPTREHGGLGLGLAIVKHLTQLHGGTVIADSGGLGLGATFTVTLPYARSHAARERENVSERPA
jgi:signal transduction histidine kinase